LEQFKIIPRSVETFGKIEKYVNQDKYKAIVNDVKSPSDYIDILKSTYYWTAVVGAFLVIVFSLISILVMINILRIAIYSRRDEIEIMRLVGATNSYIRGPFIAEGILYNFIASIFVFILFVPTVTWLSPLIQRHILVGLDSDITTITNNLYFSLTITNVIGLIIGGFSAMLATQRYLKL
jgi:cell division transport system permease protein